MANPLGTAIDDPRIFRVDIEEEVIQTGPELESESHLQHHPAFVGLLSLQDQDAVAEEDVNELLLGRIPQHVVVRGQAVIPIVVLLAEVQVVLEEGRLIPLSDIPAVEQKRDDLPATRDQRVKVVVQLVGVVKKQSFCG